MIAQQLHIAPLQADDLALSPLWAEIATILPGNNLDRQTSLLLLQENARSNQGLVLRRGDHIYAFLIYNIKGVTCRINFAYAESAYHPDILLHHLFAGLIALARADKNILSLRCDIVSWFPECIRQAMASNGFTKVERLLMRREKEMPQEACRLPSGIRLVNWESWLIKPATEMLYFIFGNGYEASWDRSLSDFAGCRQFIAEACSGRFGFFDPKISFALQFQNMWVGLALASWDQNGEGFIPSFGLLPNFVGQGLGGAMLHTLLHRYGSSTFPPTAIELAVSEENRPAVKLYHNYDFKIKSRFKVYYLNI